MHILDEEMQRNLFNRRRDRQINSLTAQIAEIDKKKAKLERSLERFEGMDFDKDHFINDTSQG